MKNIITLFLLALATFCAAQSNQVKTPGVSYSAGAPSWVPVVKTASELAIDTVAKRLYLWNRNTATWDLQGRGVDQTSGATPPAYTPGQTDSYLVINNATPPELYAWTGSAWAKVGGTIQTIDTFSVSGSVVSLSLSGDNQPAKTITLPASGITALTGDVTATGPGSAVASIANGAVTGAKLAANSVDSTKITPLSIANSDIANVAPEKLLQKGASTGQVLGWNGSIWGPTAAGVSGSGTAGFLPKFSSSTALTNSIIQESGGGFVSIGGTPPSNLQLDILSRSIGRPCLRLSDSDLDNNNKVGMMVGRHYLNSEVDVLGFWFSNISTGGRLIFGGGSASYNSAESLLFFTGNGSNIRTGTERMRITSTGNIGIGTVTPAARLHVVGSGATSATWGFQVHNSTGTNNALMVRDDGNVGVGTNAPGAKLHIQASVATDIGLIVRGATGQTAALAQFQNGAGTALTSINSNGSIVIPNSGDVSWNTFSKLVSQANGNITLYNNSYSSFGMLQFGGVGATMPGIKRHANNTLQIISSDDATASNFLVTGDVRIGTTTAVATAVLDVTSTTKGFLPPRMTAIQASAIASPAEGLMIYVTTTDATFLSKGWYGYNGAAWEKLNN